jgi:hypothetical protein
MTHHSGHGQRIATAFGAALALSWLVAASTATAQTTGVTVEQPDYYLYQVAEVPGEGGEVAFDPTDSNRPYIAVDGTLGGTLPAGIYKGGYVNGVLVAIEQVVSLDNPSGIAFDNAGDLYIVHDFTMALRVVRTPRNGAPYTTEQLITNFAGTTADDDPIAIALVPPGFTGTNVAPGDLIIADRGYNDNAPDELLVYTPGQAMVAGTPTDPAKYMRTLSSTYQLTAYNNVDLNDITFSVDGSTLYAMFANGKIAKLNAEGVVQGELAVTGVTFGTLQAIGTNPIDGRLWIADDTKDQIWSVDPATGVARLELTFTRTTATAPGAANFHYPGLQFSNDGQYFTVGDIISPGHIYMFKRRAANPNNAPHVRFTTSAPNNIVPPSGGIATITFDASTSDDGDGGTQGLTYQWLYLGTTSGVSIKNPTSASTAVTFPNVNGRYLFAVKVNDGQAANNEVVAQFAIFVPTEGSVDLYGGSYFKSAQKVFWSGTPGDIAFDAGDNSKMYIAKDDTTGNGGGIYRIDKNPDGSYAVGEKIVSVDQPCSLTFTSDGLLWWIRDGAGSTSNPYFAKVATPRNGAPYTTTGIVSNFGTATADDDPFVIRTVPAGFANGTTLLAGDLLIADAGADDDKTNAIYVYSPSNPVGSPTSYNTTFFPKVTDTTDNNINDMEFSADGTKLYLAYDKGQIVEVDNTGTVLRQLAPFGVNFSNIDAIGVNPVDGRIWVADDNLDQLWSFDPVTEEAVKEVQFHLPGERRPDFQINFHDPSLTFSPDGQRLVVTDTGNDGVSADGWIWVFDVSLPPASAPDFDTDFDVDGNDIIAFAACMQGPTIPVTTPYTCVSADFDHDGDVDLADFGYMQRCFSGSGVAWTSTCKE